jgi:hypothetical protein
MYFMIVFFCFFYKSWLVIVIVISLSFLFLIIIYVDLWCLITNVHLTHAKKSQVETESIVDIKTLVYTEKTSLWILKL